MQIPFVTERVAGRYMIQRNGPEQTGKKDAEWLTPDYKWTANIFEASGFAYRHQAQRVVIEILIKEMYLTKQQAKNTIKTIVPSHPMAKIEDFINWIYEQSSEMNINDILKHYFDFYLMFTGHLEQTITELKTRPI